MRPRQLDDWPYSYEFVPVDRLFIDPTYQRPETRLVQEIAGDFQPEIFGAARTSERSNGQHALVDGQQRVGAARLIGITTVPCLVQRGLTVRDEARIFVTIQIARLNMRPVQRFKGELAAEYPRPQAIMRILDRRGLELVESSGISAPADALSAIVALEKIWDRFGEEILEQALDVVIAAWPQMRGRFRGEILRAIAQYIAQDTPEIYRLVQTLSGPKLGTPEKLMERSSQKRRGAGLGGGSIGYTIETIREDYKARRGWHRVETPQLER